MKTFGECLEEVCAVQNGQRPYLHKLPNAGRENGLPQLGQQESVALLEESIRQFFNPSGLNEKRIRLWIEINKDYEGPFLLSFYTYLGLKVFRKESNLAKVRQKFRSLLPATVFANLPPDERDVLKEEEEAIDATRGTSARYQNMSDQQQAAMLESLQQSLHLLQWTWERLEVESARGHQEKAPNIRGLTYNIQVICTHGLLRTSTYSVLPEKPMGRGRYTTRVAARDRWERLTAAVFEGRICLDENKKPVYNPDAKIGKVLQDGEEVARLEDWIGEASEAWELEDLEHQMELILGDGRFANNEDTNEFFSALYSTAHKDGSPSSRQFLRDLARKYAYRCRARAEHEEITLGRLWTRRETDQLASALAECGNFDWKEVAKVLKTRTPGAIEKHVLKSAERIRREIARRMRRKGAPEAMVKRVFKK